jgi:IPT/TIG domain
MSRAGLFSKCTFSFQYFLILALVLAAELGRAGSGEPEVPFAGVSLAVASVTVPAGGLLQVQVSVTEPKPILKGKQGLKFAAAAVAAVASPLGRVRDAAMFSPGGDVCGVAVIGSAGTQFFFSSPLETLGTSIDTPVITLAFPVRSTATVGQSVNLTLDPNSSLWLDPNAKQYPVDLKSGVMTVGGTLSIADVAPGAGVVPAGSVISIKGTGFQPDSKVHVGDAIIATSQYISSNLIQVRLTQSIDIRGQRVRVDNTDNERAVYYPYQRTTRIGNSTHALVAASYPLFPQTARKIGYFRPALHRTVFSGLALQNLNSTSVTATLQLSSKSGTVLSTQTVMLGKNTRMARDLVELFPGVTPADGTKLKVTSSKGIQMLGLLGDDASGMVLPVLASSTP